MLKIFLLLWAILVYIPSYSQSDNRGKNGICLSSERCFSRPEGYKKKDSTGIIRLVPGVFFGLERDSLIQMTISDSIPLLPNEVDQGLEICFTEAGTKDLLNILDYKRNFNSYRWKLAYCSYPGTGIDPATTFRAKEITSVWFEVNAFNEIQVRSISQHLHKRKISFISNKPKRVDKEVLKSAFFHHVTVKSAVWKKKMSWQKMFYGFIVLPNMESR